MLIAIALTLAAASGAQGGNNFGARFVTSSCCTLYGDRSDIRLPSTQFVFPPSGGFALMRVAADRPEGIWPGGSAIQVGYAARNANQQFSGCDLAHGTVITGFSETLLPFYGSPLCSWYGANTLLTTHKYSVNKYSGDQWITFIDGSLKDSENMCASSCASYPWDCCSDRVLAGGEIAVGPSAVAQVYGCYGCDGNLAWQRATAPSGNGWFTIQQANPINTDGQWLVQAPPSPLAFYHGYP